MVRGTRRLLVYLDLAGREGCLRLGRGLESRARMGRAGNYSSPPQSQLARHSPSQLDRGGGCEVGEEGGIVRV
jgi:hypothetical protein